MKNLILTIAVLFIGSSIYFSCSKEIAINGQDLEALVPANPDENAGTWKTVILTSGAEIALDAPKETNSAEYQAELASVKSGMSNLSEEQKNIIKYWSAGGVLRWNQILRELMAKYNLPSVANADGTYSLPNSATPTVYPYFPFSNPCYAARSYAYVSVAQYDALIAAYHYKELYDRKAPYKNDASITPLVPANDLGSYPSEDAVVAAVTLEMMKFLFPGEVTYLEAKAAEQKNYRLWAGANVQSDIDAGDILGKAVAAKILARAKSDGMKNAAGNKTKWDSLSALAKTQTGLLEPWVSLEIPARPPMLPMFKDVKPLLFASSELAVIRPGAPPKTDSEEFHAALAEVKKETTSGDRRKLGIVHFWADGVGTYTPPGHWNYIAEDMIYKAKYSEVRTARAFALLNMTQMDAAISCWDTKNYYYYPRPSQMDPSIKTLTGLPNFQSYTSGHSTFSGAAATILGYLFPSEQSRLNAFALEASLSRLYGGIHYRFDCEAGVEAGKKIGNYAIERAKTDGAN